LNHTPQRGANEGNAADDALMVNQGGFLLVDVPLHFFYIWPFQGAFLSIYIKGTDSPANHAEGDSWTDSYDVDL
jgi:hypothetical protein